MKMQDTMKTAFSLNLADTACRNGVHTLFFSLEMGSGPLIRRMVSNVGRIDSKKFENPSKKFQPEDWKNHAMAYGILERYPMHLYDTPGLTVRDMRARCRKVMKKYPDEKYLMIVDYLQLIHGDSRKDRHREIGEISQGLKELAKELHIPVVALAQLNRGVEQRQDKRPVLSDLRDSGEIEQAADLVAFLHRDDYYNPGEQGGTIEVIVAKHRNGPVGVAELAYIKEHNKFANLERRVTA
jgi:replicative DNA helicase